jgi:Tfp pilus assembly protein FimV
MKKIIFCLVLILSLVVLFACASPPPASAPAPAPAPAPAEQPPPPPEPARAEAPPARTTDLILDGAEIYTVVRGDTLSKIASRKYQNGFYYPLIMMASNNVVTDQDLIEPGMVLTIPRLQANLNDTMAKESMKKFFMEIAVITDRKRPADAAGLRKLAGSL